jgi:hypothetical protein
MRARKPGLALLMAVPFLALGYALLGGKRRAPVSAADESVVPPPDSPIYDTVVPPPSTPTYS